MDGTGTDAKACDEAILYALYGSKADRLEIAALEHAADGDLARFVGYSAQADDIRIMEQKARTHAQ